MAQAQPIRARTVPDRHCRGYQRPLLRYEVHHDGQSRGRWVASSRICSLAGADQRMSVAEALWLSAVCSLAAPVQRLCKQPDRGRDANLVRQDSLKAMLDGMRFNNVAGRMEEENADQCDADGITDLQPHVQDAGGCARVMGFDGVHDEPRERPDEQPHAYAEHQEWDDERPDVADMRVVGGNEQRDVADDHQAGGQCQDLSTESRDHSTSSG
jgi:hypothetical protein